MADSNNREVRLSPAFWVAFRDGMTSPTSLFAAPPNYDRYVVPIGPSQSFAIVGTYFSNVLGPVEDGEATDRRHLLNSKFRAG